MLTLAFDWTDRLSFDHCAYGGRRPLKTVCHTASCILSSRTHLRFFPIDWSVAFLTNGPSRKCDAQQQPQNWARRTYKQSDVCTKWLEPSAWPATRGTTLLVLRINCVTLRPRRTSTMEIPAGCENSPARTPLKPYLAISVHQLGTSQSHITSPFCWPWTRSESNSSTVQPLC